MLSLLLLLAGCNPLPFDAVSISPIYGWVDGCNTVTISGHGFGDDVSATIGGKPVTDVTLPTRELDKGYLFTATVPAGDQPGYADVTVSTGGKSDTITGSGAYYYVACPAPGTIDAVDPAEGLTAGATVTITGCGLDAAAVRVQLVDATGAAAGDALAIASGCGTARVTFTAPDLAAGTYYVETIDAEGNVLAGTPCPPPDTADTANTCTDYPVTYGGAR